MSSATATATGGVAVVERNGPAGLAGVRPGDLIVAVNGQPTETARAVIRTVAGTTPGKNVQVLLLRQGRSMEINITVGRRPREEN